METDPTIASVLLTPKKIASKNQCQSLNGGFGGLEDSATRTVRAAVARILHADSGQARPHGRWISREEPTGHRHVYSPKISGTEYTRTP